MALKEIDGDTCYGKKARHQERIPVGAQNNPQTEKQSQNSVCPLPQRGLSLLSIKYTEIGQGANAINEQKGRH